MFFRNVKYSCTGALLVLAILTFPALAETTIKRTPKSIPVGMSVFDARKPSNYQKDTQYVYNTYFSHPDKRIEDNHVSLWQYHEVQSSYGSTVGAKDTLLQIGSQSNRLVRDVRREQAERTLRVRMESALKSYLEQGNAAREIKRLHKTISNLKNISVSLPSGNTKQPAQLRVGYDVFTDASKVEYAATHFTVGAYHPHLIGSATHAKPATKDVMNLSVSANIGDNLPRPSISYRLNGKIIQTRLSKDLSSSVTANLSSEQPITRDAHEKYDLSIAYRF